ncbi:MAG: nickel pincer cofactor biosynthesis protein LarC [Methanocellales archaeon]|nr:nickel pincer cofactor biosynthesis protein LarC [Methanocellales archaeon]MDD3291590.1 nickel pincer cofactor biosynthesis protein LarC [Methanocellales archaeon]MDD5235159.1 nickel pincer cofactor biosynthesis protein LarC [Methanocellales archaeon]MDD5485373.1 nickel pincer cofactor biosynthesis protein LarC [Methanocellales archaeon]
MKTVIFNPSSGVSGDMIVASLVDLGANKNTVKKAMTSIGDVNVKISKVSGLGISATRVNVTSADDWKTIYTGITEGLKESGLDDAVIGDSIAICERIADAQSKVNGELKGRSRLRDVGSVDAIAVVIGACAAFHNLGFDKFRIRSTPICMGRGSAQTSIGRLSILATIEILRNSCLWNITYHGGPATQELTNQTGAAILAHFVKECNIFFPKVEVNRVGYGTVSRAFETPNVLRTVIGETDEMLSSDRIDVLETDVDDVTGEVLGKLIRDLMSSGARDVSIMPATMKEGRPGHIIQVMAQPADTTRLARKIIQETGSPCTRVMPVKRLITERHISTTVIDVGEDRREVRVKISTDRQGKTLSVSAEFEDCKKVAEELGVSVKEIIRKAECVAWSRLS